jgi:hypothetical protein
MKIPQVIDPADMADSPDELANMTYISYFRDYVSSRPSMMIALLTCLSAGALP